MNLARKDDVTQIQLSSRNDKLAREHGIAPKEGKAKLVLGNANEADVVIVIGAQEHKLAAGLGAKEPADAKKLDIEPGKHRIVVKVPGAEPDTQEIDVKAGTTWGVIAFPGGGAFVAQVY